MPHISNPNDPQFGSITISLYSSPDLGASFELTDNFESTNRGELFTDTLSRLTKHRQKKVTPGEFIGRYVEKVGGSSL